MGHILHYFKCGAFEWGFSTTLPIKQGLPYDVWLIAMLPDVLALRLLTLLDLVPIQKHRYSGSSPSLGDLYVNVNNFPSDYCRESRTQGSTPNNVFMSGDLNGLCLYMCDGTNL